MLSLNESFDESSELIVNLVYIKLFIAKEKQTRRHWGHRVSWRRAGPRTPARVLCVEPVWSVFALPFCMFPVWSTLYFCPGFPRFVSPAPFHFSPPNSILALPFAVPKLLSSQACMRHTLLILIPSFSPHFLVSSDQKSLILQEQNIKRTACSLSRLSSFVGG